MTDEKRFEIAKSDLHLVISYLRQQLLKNPWFPNDETCHDAHSDFNEIKNRLSKLNSWLNHYLYEEQWVRLQAAVRQRRRRAKYPEVKNVTISFTAWSYLKDVADRDEVTLSEVIETYLKKEWKKTHGIK